MRRTSTIALLVGVLTGLAPAMARAEEPQRYLERVFDDVEVTTDVVYGHAVNDRGELQELELDVYQPVGDPAEERPVFVWAHGGSLVTGDKAGSLERQVGQEFARRGWVVVSIEYRLMSKLLEECPNDIICATSPALLQALDDGQHDMQAAVRWVRANAIDLRADTDEITVGGHSAGTALALLTAFSPEDPGASGNPGYPSDVAAAMTNSGTLFEPTSIGPGEPPIVSFNAVDDPDLTLWVNLAMTCLPTTSLGNVCELHVYDDGGHSLSIHRADVFQKTAEFFCRRVIDGCAVSPGDASGYTGPSGSTWATDVECGDASDDLLVDPAVVSLSGRGVEVCADGGLGGLQGRTFLDLAPDGMPRNLQLDGDPDNPLLRSALHLPGNPVTVATGVIDVVTSGLGSLGGG